MAIKPPFSAVPMTDAQHKNQTWFGEASLLTEYHYYQVDGSMVTNKQACAWFERKRDEMVAKWIEHRKQLTNRKD